ncbi:hypothetical protein [Bacillus paranthracis]|uniref:hypothetical protein n=1 Tax=Bacillus paranthracis TaxID=2026186 RepID=UPI003014A9DA
MGILENEEFKNFIMEDIMNEVYSEVNGEYCLKIGEPLIMPVVWVVRGPFLFWIDSLNN